MLAVKLIHFALYLDMLPDFTYFSGLNVYAYLQIHLLIP